MVVRALEQGGDGLERTFRFLEPMTVGVLSGSQIAPFGLAGGCDGACGRNQISRADETVQELPGCVQLEVLAGDCLTLATPGGGAGVCRNAHDRWVCAG